MQNTKDAGKQNPGFGVRKQQRPHFITYKPGTTLLSLSQFPHLQWDSCRGYIMSRRYSNVNYGVSYTLKSSSSPPLSVLLASPLSAAPLFFLLCGHSHCRLHCDQHRGHCQQSCRGCDPRPPSSSCAFSVLAPVIIVLVTTPFLTIFTPHPTTPTKGGSVCSLAPSSLLKVFHKPNSHTVRLEESYLCSLVWSTGFCKKHSVPAHAEWK